MPPERRYGAVRLPRLPGAGVVPLALLSYLFCIKNFSKVTMFEKLQNSFTYPDALLEGRVPPFKAAAFSL
jgi:hypothetical protein